MQDMSSQMLSNLLVYFFQSHCVLDQDSHTGQSCPWWAYHDAMKVNFALVFSSPDLVSKFIEELMQQNWSLIAVAIIHGFFATTVGGASIFLVVKDDGFVSARVGPLLPRRHRSFSDRCGRCTRMGDRLQPKGGI